MGVEFNEDNNLGGMKNPYVQKTPKIAGWLIEKGWAKDEPSANKIQIIASIIFFALAIFFAF